MNPNEGTIKPAAGDKPTPLLKIEVFFDIHRPGMVFAEVSDLYGSWRTSSCDCWADAMDAAIHRIEQYMPSI